MENTGTQLNWRKPYPINQVVNCIKKYIYKMDVANLYFIS